MGNARRAAGLIAVGLLAVACSSSDDDGAEPEDDATIEPEAERTCDQGATTDEVEAVPVEGVADDLTVTSFDGTEIRVHWFPTDATGDEPAPTILLGSGWAQAGATLDRDMVLGYGATPIVPMLDAGYNVLTWDPRCFGESTGEANVDSPEHEGRDVQVLLDFVAEQPEAQTDAEGDPRVGMVGASYGGGIQFVVGAIDCRVDALVPAIAWHSLVTSLYPSETAKSGWGNLLTQAVATFQGSVDPHVTAAAETGLVTGVIDDEIIDWFDERGPGDLVADITAPTLIIQGTVDNLFTPTEGITNFEALQAAGTPVSLLWFCGGHGMCLTGDGDADLVDARTLAWLDRYLKGDEDADVGPVVDYVDQAGDRWVGDDHPSEPDDVLSAEGEGGVLTLSADSHSGPVDVGELAEGQGGDTAAIFAGITPATADVAVELTATAEDDALVLGVPTVSFSYRGTVPDGVQPTRLFAQLVDDETGLVLGNQIVPVPLVLDGEEHEVEADLELVVHHLVAGRSVTLQLVATTPAFAVPRLGGDVAITDLRLDLPVVTSLTPAG